jgi:hypothetical protein
VGASERRQDPQIVTRATTHSPRDQRIAGRERKRSVRGYQAIEPGLHGVGIRDDRPIRTGI